MSLDPLRNEEDIKEYVDIRLGPMGEIGDCVANFDGETIGVFNGEYTTKTDECIDNKVN